MRKPNKNDMLPLLFVFLLGLCLICGSLAMAQEPTGDEPVGEEPGGGNGQDLLGFTLQSVPAAWYPCSGFALEAVYDAEEDALIFEDARHFTGTVCFDCHALHQGHTAHLKSQQP
jgi:hypothetical protein